MFPSSLHSPPVAPSTEKRAVKEVPFVELLDGRIQGVVSSGSDIQRVYVSYFEARTLNFYCSTNNNRPCGGLGGSPCKHLRHLLTEAVKQYSLEAIVKYLQVPGDTTQITSEADILKQAGQNTHVPIGAIFSRFLAYLQLVELPNSHLPLPEMDWFNTGG